MRGPVLAALCVALVVLAGCSAPPPDTGNPEDLALIQTGQPLYAPERSLNVAETTEGEFRLFAVPGCAADAMECAADAASAAVGDFNVSRFEIRWTITGQGLEGPVATGVGASIVFPLAHATAYHAQAHVHDMLLNETVLERSGSAQAHWTQEISGQAAPGVASRVTLSEIPATVKGQSLHADVSVTSTAGPAADGSLVIVYPTGEEEQFQSGAEVKLGDPGAYTLQWQAVLPVQTPQTVSGVAVLMLEGEGGHDMMNMEG